uniref:Gelsolin-like domain-containing protein n=1 Tax=Spongospora subterranea TaxID=70186 RepID=A0A0H5R6Z9_9EUKA|eukprot:CRZ09888.1 hypothetical protein [Spongospora subterranea]
MSHVKFEDSNIAGLNSETAIQVRKAAAACEVQFSGAGKEPGVLVWRVENFGVKKQPKEQHGQFFDGDSYIVLNTYKPSSDKDKLAYNVHFWLGANTTQDEAGTAAFKTVELDTLLSDLPIQYREVQGFESDEFLKLFKPAMMTLSGGIQSGFHVVKPTDYKPRLLHVKGVRKAVSVVQVPTKRESLNQGDVFILDNGLSIYQWNGSCAGVYEKRKANEIAAQIRESRGCKPTFQVLDDQEKCDAFWSVLGGQGPVKSAEAGGPDDQAVKAVKKLLRLSDACGQLTVSEVASGTIKKSMLDTNDVFLIDVNGNSLLIWVGAKASQDERAKCFQYANKYIQDAGIPFTVPVSRVIEGTTSPSFEQAFE